MGAYFATRRGTNLSSIHVLSTWVRRSTCPVEHRQKQMWMPPSWLQVKKGLYWNLARNYISAKNRCPPLQGLSKDGLFDFPLTPKGRGYSGYLNHCLVESMSAAQEGGGASCPTDKWQTSPPPRYSQNGLAWEHITSRLKAVQRRLQGFPNAPVKFFKVPQTRLSTFRSVDTDPEIWGRTSRVGFFTLFSWICPPSKKSRNMFDTIKKKSTTLELLLHIHSCHVRAHLSVYCTVWSRTKGSKERCVYKRCTLC